MAKTDWKDGDPLTAPDMNTLGAEVTAATGATRDTGLRNITTLVAARTAGSIYVVRSGSWCELTLIDVAFGTLTGMQEFAGLVPDGFRPPGWRHYSSSPHSDDTPNGMLIKPDGTLRIYSLSAGEVLQSTFTYYTNQAWPSTLPGV